MRGPNSFADLRVAASPVQCCFPQTTLSPTADGGALLYLNIAFELAPYHEGTRRETNVLDA